ncbi:hypothetical protein [Bacillus horti]|uniref:Lycopene cyclase domain-containing protein n=1 Tax=Caldalkalibacillus horti TaxID=77523 RepID=A0ABT9W260_9BACI|nr:hypothetical protein [Bacillus horti]MDQ0167334.1 hypothetical protein [Bacillus horti]
MHYVAAAIQFLLPVILGAVLGSVHVWRLYKRDGEWNFNWILFLIVVPPLLFIGLMSVLGNHLNYYPTSLQPVINIIIPFRIVGREIVDYASIIAGFVFMLCFFKRETFKNKDVVVK